MSYRRFKITQAELPLATLATPATVQASDPRSVARIASVASAEPNLSAEEPATVANVASVARQELKSQPEPKLSIKGQSAVAEDGEGDVILPFTLATLATAATLPDKEAPSVAKVATVVAEELDFST